MMKVNLYFLIFLLLSLIFYSLSLYFLTQNFSFYLEYSCLILGSYNISVTLIFDWVSLMFASLVYFISSMIMKYSEEYMYEEINLKRFFLLMILFVISMMLLIFSMNLVSILLGWDGLGLVSFILVIFYQNVKSMNAGMLTALLNRIGDVALLMSIAYLSFMGEWNNSYYLEFFSKNFVTIFMISMFIILASFTKSAQIPFSSWLPSAMAAPTPVSSLVHSSTLVTAGVYLLMRFNYLLSDNFMQMILYISLLTMFMAGLCANFEYDLKKIIAYSTLSQLGMMILILSLGEINLVFFHLFTHAFFKALLFMCAGAIIHNLNNCQDIRLMGGLLKYMPIIFVCFSISNFALCGLPFLSGFYSKDLIAEYLSMNLPGLFIYMLFFISVGLTVSYSMRLFYYTMFSDYKFVSMVYISEKNNKIMLKGMFGLVILVIFMGAILWWFLSFTPFISILPFYMKIFTLLMILLGIYIGMIFSKMKYYFSSKTNKFFKLMNFISNMWNLSFLSTSFMNYFILKLSKSLFKNIDRGWMEYYGSMGLFYLMKKISMFIQSLLLKHMKVFLIFLFVFLALIIIYELIN